MKQIVPEYYSHFRCIADQCRHSCCIGWEIDVDEASLRRYRAVSGPLGELLAREIVADDEGWHFRLGPGDRCPLLEESGLCRLFRELGEESLCQICADHPRFRNELSDRTETGLGLCCEAAAQLILGWEPPMALLETEDGEEAGEPAEDERFLLALRARLFAVLQNREKPLEERLAEVLQLCGGAIPEKSGGEWAAFYRSLERLDPAWDAVLEGLTQPTQPLGSAWDVPFEQLAVYFVFRHLTGALEDGALAARAAFAVLGVEILRRLFAAQPRQSLEVLAELARFYSSELEYSQDNMDAVLELLS